jgi:tetratricopeptide (TPR) repeat protein
MFPQLSYQLVSVLGSSLMLAMLFGVPCLTNQIEARTSSAEPYQKYSTPKNDAQTLIGEGNRWATIGRWPEAVEAYQRAIELDSRSALAHGHLAHAYTQMGRYQEAIASLQHAISLQPANAVFSYNLGNVYLKLNRPLESIELFEQAISLKPDYFQAYNDLGNAFAELADTLRLLPP